MFDHKRVMAFFSVFGRFLPVVFVFPIVAVLFLEYGSSLKGIVLGTSVIQDSPPQLAELDPNFLNQVNKCFIPTAAVYGYTLRITSGFRSMTEQNQIFDQGRTVDGHIVSWAEPGKSLHNYGFAVDVVDRWKGYNVDWKKLGEIGAFCGLRQDDDAHFENRGNLTVDQFAAGERPLPLSLPCTIMEDRVQANQPLTLKDLNNCGSPKF
jgi:hypothetical protein